MKRLMIFVLTILFSFSSAYAQQGFSGITGLQGISGNKGVKGVRQGSISPDRILPQNVSIVAVMRAAQYPHLVLLREGSLWAKILTLGLGGTDDVTLEMAVNVRVRDANNRFITYGRLNEYVGHPVAVRFDNQNKVADIWILTPNERKELAGRIGYWQ